jgi:XapX domain-containing protein
MKLLLGLVVAFAIGLACRVFDIPAPAPPMWQGALLVVAMTLGYTGGDYLMKKRAAAPAAQTTRVDRATPPPRDPAP